MLLLEAAWPMSGLTPSARPDYEGGAEGNLRGQVKSFDLHFRTRSSHIAARRRCCFVTPANGLYCARSPQRDPSTRLVLLSPSCALGNSPTDRRTCG